MQVQRHEVLPADQATTIGDEPSSRRRGSSSSRADTHESPVDRKPSRSRAKAERQHATRTV
jgi:hypothetical protein